jgi:lipid II:glycine glycyltransferase (peptidoglycan interpeptide bridge formation enzyme)
MHPKTRYNIKVAQRHGIIVEPTFVATPGHGLNLKEALDLVVDTAKRQGFRGYARPYYEGLIDFFALQPHRDLQLSVYKARWQGHLLAAAIMIDFGATRVYLFGGSSENNKNLMAPHLLHWQAIRDAAANGLKYYDFWGLETSTGKSAGFARFKQGFGGRTVTDPPASDIVLKPMWYTLYRITRKLRRLIG